MPKQQSEPESYTVDEMMDRLREGEREKEEKSTGELVTRADGTQAIRIRKRKRRTQQPEQEKKQEEVRRRSLTIPLLIGLGVIVVGLIVAMVVLLARYNSAGFREGIEAGLEERSGAEVTLQGVAVTPGTARVKTLELEWGGGHALSSLTLSDLSANLSLGSFLSGNWEGEQVVAESGEMVISGVDGAVVARRAEPALTYSEYRCDFLNVYFGEVGKGSRLKNVELTMRKGPEGETQLLLDNGEAIFSGWSPLVVDRGTGEFAEGGLKLISLRMAPKEGEGEINFFSQKLLTQGEDINLGIRMDAFPLSAFIGDDLGAMLSSVVNSQSGALSFDGASLGESELRVEFTSKAATLEKLPFLHILHTRLGDSEFLKPQFDQVKGVFIRDQSGRRLQELELIAPYQMVVRGHLEVDNEGALSGRLEVGVGEGKIMTLTNRKRSDIFSDPREGYCWVTINLGGTLENPIDNMQALLQKSAREAAERGSLNGVETP